MRIDGNPIPDQEGYLNRTGRGQGAHETGRTEQHQDDSGKGPSAPRSAGALDEKVVLSAGGREVLRARQLAESAPDVRREKVAELKEAVQQGRYRVDAEKVVDGLLNDPLLGLLP